jgi:hypothetical protein
MSTITTKDGTLAEGVTGATFDIDGGQQLVEG